MASNKIKPMDKFNFYGPGPTHCYKSVIEWGMLRYNNYRTMDENDCVKWRSLTSKLMTIMYGE